jgi:hypothetical protein
MAKKSVGNIAAPNSEMIPIVKMPVILSELQKTSKAFTTAEKIRA